MANRYWVGGTGNWSDNTNHWSTASGGSGGASLPTSADDVFVDSNSGLSGGTITLDTTTNIHDFICISGHNYAINDSSALFNIYGSLLLEAGIALTYGRFIFYSTSLGETITTAGLTIQYFYFYGVGGGWILQDNLTSTSEFYQENGTFDANDHDVTASDFYFYADSGYTPVIIMGSGTWEATGYGWEVDEYSGEIVSITPETSTIKLSNNSSSEKYFYETGDAGNGQNVKTYNNIWLTGGGTGLFHITGSNIFNDFKIDAGLTLKVNAITASVLSDTITVNTFTAIGSAGNLITLNTYYKNGRIISLSVKSFGSGYQNGDILTIVGGTDGFANIGAGGSVSFNVSGSYGYSTGTNIATTGGHGTGCTVNITEVANGQFNLVKTGGGVISADYLNISNSNATPGTTWYAGSHSLDTGGNSGWVFTVPSANGMFLIF